MTLEANQKMMVVGAARDRRSDMTDEHVADEALARRAGAGDEAAFELLVERHQNRVYRLAMRMMSNPSDAEEIVQEAFLNAYRGLSSFRADAKFGTWLYQIVVNGALARRRSAGRRPTTSLEEQCPRFDATAPRELGIAARADDLLERKQLRRRIQDALDRLEEHHRTIFVLRDLEGLSTEEVAEIFAIQEPAVRQRLHRARLQLREILGDLLHSA